MKQYDIERLPSWSDTDHDANEDHLVLCPACRATTTKANPTSLDSNIVKIVSLTKVRDTYFDGIYGSCHKCDVWCPMDTERYRAIVIVKN